MNFFELNEELKEKLVQDYSATLAKTTYFKDGVLLLPEPFYETMVTWDEDLDLDVVNNVIYLIKYYREEINKNSHMTELLFEFTFGKSTILWSIFPTKEAPEGTY